MIRKDKGDISDLEYEKIAKDCDETIFNYLKENVIDEFIALYIATLYKNDALWDDALDLHINSALDYFSDMTLDDCDKLEIKSILEDKYKLKIMKEVPLEIDEIQKNGEIQ